MDLNLRSSLGVLGRIGDDMVGNCGQIFVMVFFRLLLGDRRNFMRNLLISRCALGCIMRVLHPSSNLSAVLVTPF